MSIFINAFLIGITSGLRALIGLAAVSRAAHFTEYPRRCSISPHFELFLVKRNGHVAWRVKSSAY